MTKRIETGPVELNPRELSRENARLRQEVEDLKRDKFQQLKDEKDALQRKLDEISEIVACDECDAEAHEDAIDDVLSGRQHHHGDDEEE